MTWLALFFAIEMGISPDGGWAFYDEPAGYVYQQIRKEPMYTALEATLVALEVIRFRSVVTTWTTRMGAASFAPLWVTFDTDVYLQIGGVRVGWFHACTHPLQVYTASAGYSTPALEGAWNRWYIRYEGDSRGRR